MIRFAQSIRKSLPGLPVHAFLILLSLKTHAEKIASQPSADVSEPVFLLTGPLSLDEKYLGDIDLKVTASGHGQLDSHRLLQLLEPLISPELYNAFSALANGKNFGLLPNFRSTA